MEFLDIYGKIYEYLYSLFVCFFICSDAWTEVKVNKVDPLMVPKSETFGSWVWNVVSRIFVISSFISCIRYILMRTLVLFRSNMFARINNIIVVRWSIQYYRVQFCSFVLYNITRFYSEHFMKTDDEVWRRKLSRRNQNFAKDTQWRIYSFNC